MAEPSRNRVDLSAIHPLKRVTLIVLWFMFGTSLVFALATQFVRVSIYLESPGSLLSVIGLEKGIVLVQTRLGSGGWDLHFSHGSDIAVGWIDDSMPENTVSFPSLSFVARVWSTVTIHHLWLIGTSAALYLFTRWRIRCTTRLQSLPS